MFDDYLLWIITIVANLFYLVFATDFENTAVALIALYRVVTATLNLSLTRIAWFRYIVGFVVTSTKHLE